MFKKDQKKSFSRWSIFLRFLSVKIVFINLNKNRHLG